ncbi:hypothetical protein ACX12E_12220 [Paenibacillus vandeheii]
MSQPFDYKGYWERTYSSGKTSGRSSYGVLADFKAEGINGLIEREGISSVIEFGYGDGNQLQYMNYKTYLGVDVAGSSIQLCASKFTSDSSKSFMLYMPGLWINRGFLQADLTICLDVLYHITDETDFRNTLYDILHASSEWVVLYTRLKENENPGVRSIEDRNI